MTELFDTIVSLDRLLNKKFYNRKYIEQEWNMEIVQIIGGIRNSIHLVIQMDELDRTEFDKIYSELVSKSLIVDESEILTDLIVSLQNIGEWHVIPQYALRHLEYAINVKDISNDKMMKLIEIVFPFMQTVEDWTTLFSIDETLSFIKYLPAKIAIPHAKEFPFSLKEYMSHRKDVDMKYIIEDLRFINESPVDDDDDDEDDETTVEYYKILGTMVDIDFYNTILLECVKNDFAYAFFYIWCARHGLCTPMSVTAQNTRLYDLVTLLQDHRLFFENHEDGWIRRNFRNLYHKLSMKAWPCLSQEQRSTFFKRLISMGDTELVEWFICHGAGLKEILRLQKKSVGIRF